MKINQKFERYTFVKGQSFEKYLLQNNKDYVRKLKDFLSKSTPKKIRWDYSNYKPGGKNIYFFRNNNHISNKIQNRLFNELEKKINSKIFKVIFTEGIPSQRIKKTNGRKYPSAVRSIRNNYCKEILSGTLIVNPLDDILLMRKYLSVISELKIIDEKIDKKEDFDIKFAKRLFKEEEFLNRKRNKNNMRKMISEMKQLNINSSALIFGEGHYKGMTSILRDRQVGWASFFPGIEVANEYEISDYVDYLSSVNI